MLFLESPAEGLPQDANAAYIEALVALESAGKTVVDRRNGKSWREVTTAITGLQDPRCRVLNVAEQPFDLIGAVARFAWLINGDDRADTIAFYAPHVRRFERDGRIPGSSYGHRMRRGRDGIDQITGAIARLRDDPRTRQAAAVIWEPADAVREPFDIPCALATTFRWREDGLSGSTIMRSNKPYTLLPYNLFEFSMLAEIVACELNAPVSPYVHVMLVAQLPDIDDEGSTRMLRYPRRQSLSMQPMPQSPSPLSQLQIFSEVEIAIRNSRSYEQACDHALNTPSLHEYWRNLAVVLAMRWLVANAEWSTLQQEVVRLLPKSLSQPLQQKANLALRTGTERKRE